MVYELGEPLKEHITVDNRDRQKEFLIALEERFTRHECWRQQGELQGIIARDLWNAGYKHLWHAVREYND